MKDHLTMIAIVILFFGVLQVAPIAAIYYLGAYEAAQNE